MRKILGGLLIIFITLGVLLAGEGMFRLTTRAFPTASNATYEPDIHTMYRHKPSSSGWEVSPVDEFEPALVEYNSLGFRGVDFPLEKPSGEQRVALLGDSIVEGRQMGEDQTMASRLQNMLGEETGDDVRVINAGVSAFTTTTANLMLKQYVLPTSPDIVVYVFFANDYADNYVYGNYGQYDGILDGDVPARLIPDMSGPNWRDQPLPWLRRHSAMVHYALSIGDREATAKSLRQVDAVQGQSDDFRQSARNINKPVLNADEVSVLEFTHSGLEAMNRACRELGIPFVIAIMPFPPQVSAEEWKTGKQRYGFAPDATMTTTVYQDRLVEFGREHSIPVVDLLPALRKSSAEATNFLNYDGHLTEAGHTATAAALVPTISSLLKNR